MNERIWRWRYIVDWKLQGSLIVHGVLYGIVVLVAVSFGIFMPLLWDLGGATPDHTVDEQAIVMLYLHERFWLIAAVCLFIVVLGATKFSHRVAGPMVRFKRNLLLLSDGKLTPPLRTRRGDYLKEEVDCLNEAIEGVGARIDDIRRKQLDVRRQLTALLDAAPERESEIQPVVAACDQLETAVRAFQHIDPGDERRPVTQSQGAGTAVATPVGGA